MEGISDLMNRLTLIVSDSGCGDWEVRARVFYMAGDMVSKDDALITQAYTIIATVQMNDMKRPIHEVIIPVLAEESCSRFSRFAKSANKIPRPLNTNGKQQQVANSEIIPNIIDAVAKPEAALFFFNSSFER